MSEYRRLGYEDFWKVYGEAVIAADEAIVTPVLASTGVFFEPKWRWDSNDYKVTTPNGKSLRITFDAPKPNAPLEIEVAKSDKDMDGSCSKLTLWLPRQQWSSLREKFKQAVLFAQA